MIYNYFTAFRTINRNKFNAIIKTLGIAISLITLLFITVFISHEISYDKHISNSETIYRVIRNWQQSKIYSPSTPSALLREMVAGFPEIETGSRLEPMFDETVICEGNIYQENNVIGVDPSFFNTFSLQLIEGNSITALVNPGSVAISVSKAHLYFGNANPIGKRIEFEGPEFNEDNKFFTITGVYPDYPKNTHFRPQLLLSLKSFNFDSRNEHQNHSIATYVKLKSGSKGSSIESKLPGFMKGFYGDEYYNFARSTYLLQPITDIHLNASVYPYGYETPSGNTNTIILFPLLGLFILIIASINYLNLTIAEGMKRVKSFWINKVSGAGRRYFVSLFSAESQIIIGFAILITVVLSPVLLPYFNIIMGRDLNIELLTSSNVLIIMTLIVLLLLLLNSVVPAFVFSKKRAIDYFSGKFSFNGSKNSFHSVSQTIQFSICIFLIIGSIVIYRQLTYINSKTNESMSIENVLVINNARYLLTSRKAFKQKLLDIPAVKSVSICSEIPGNGRFSNWGYPIDKALEQAHVTVFECDYDYFKTLDIAMVEGRFFDPGFPTDENAVVLNQAAIKRLGWEENPIGKRYRIGKEFHVIGVANDIHYESLQNQIDPLAFIPNRNETSSSRIIIKLTSKEISESIKQINLIWKEFVPHRDMQFEFLNQEYDQWYKTERRTSALSIILSLLAIPDFPGMKK
jgi:putative ABC transport system permease protein